MRVSIPCVQIFEDLPEKVSSVSLNQDPTTGTQVAVMRFQSLASLAHFLGWRKCSTHLLHMIDDEGDIWVQPTCIKMVYEGPEGTDPRSVECELEVKQTDHWERFLRFLQRYAAAHGLNCGDPDTERAISGMDKHPCPG
ncbi:MAG: photosystem II reaction center protein Psb28 [Leptolyngbya sp. SIOISBB]|nr:photosystem II reaction center protein Psb28 [Leptolyngbya sp. SIOISBB]